MNPEELRAAVIELADQLDAVYTGLSPVLAGWDAARGRFHQLSTGTTQDVSAVDGAFAAGSDAFYAFADTVAVLSPMLRTLASQY